MKNTTTLKASAGVAALGLALLAAPAFAQEAEEVATEVSEGTGTITVTGSRISNPNLKLSSPVSVVSEVELQLRQVNTAEQFLRELPAAVADIGSAVNNGNSGGSFVNLRGIGAQRNLVLLDGRRIVPFNTSGVVDLNTIPLAMIERTDVLTGGATTTYGADAISGVVNFVTKKNFEGVQMDVSKQITERGDGENFRVDLTMGGNFADGRGNAVLSLGYQNQGQVLQGDRRFSQVAVDSFGGFAGGSSAAVPAFVVGPAGPGPAIGGLNADGTPNNTGQINLAGTDITPRALDNPFNFNPFNLFQTPFERYNVFAQANYEVADNIEVYTQGLFSRTNVSTIVAPGGSFFNTYQFNLNNPFIPDALAQRFGDRLGLTPAQFAAARNTQFGPTLADGSINPDYVEFGAQVRRRTTEAGVRTSDYTTNLFNAVFGLRGDLSDSIKWDISGTYGESENTEVLSGFASLNRLQQSVLAIPNGAGGVQCIDPSRGCAPVNLFGTEGNLGSPEAIAFAFGLNPTLKNFTSLATVNGLVSGDLPFAIASTPIAFAVGADYRKYTARQVPDEPNSIPGEVVGGGGAQLAFDGSYAATDVFGELIIPLLENVPGFQSLTLELGGRYSDIDIVGNEFTWKAGGSWEPFDGLRFRGNYQRAARAPNIFELFRPETTGLDNLSVDPCALAAPVNDPGLAAVCIAQGAPAGVIGSILNPAAGQINVTNSGNLDLGFEIANTWTIGFVAQPRAIPGLTISMDYFNIRLNRAITSPAIGDIIDGCYNTGNVSMANPACQRIERSQTAGGLDGSPDEVRGLLLGLSNLGQIKTDGIDLSINYSTSLTNYIGLNLGVMGTWTNSNKFRSDVTNPVSVDRECVGFFSVNCGSLQPEFVFDNRASLLFGDDALLSLRWRYLTSLQQEPLDIETQGGAFVGESPVLGNVDFQNIPAQSYFDLTAQFNVTKNMTFTLTATNLFDNRPPIVGFNIGSTAFNSGNTFPSTFDALGRRYAAAVSLRF
jgi:iron complex outermembrane recepter protein